MFSLLALTTVEGISTIIPILQMKKPWLREVNGPAQDLTAKSVAEFLPPGLSAAKASLLSAVLGEGQAGVQAYSYPGAYMVLPR